jgi:putative heme iron utilization protein
MTHPFTPDIIEAVLKHMNADHRGHSLDIVQVLGNQPAATAVELVGLDPAAAVYTAQVAGDSVEVRIPWSEPITERVQFRSEFARMAHEAESQAD